MAARVSTTKGLRGVADGDPGEGGVGLLRGAGGDGGDVLAGEEEAVADLGDGEHGDDAGGAAGGLEIEGVEHGAGVRAAQGRRRGPRPAGRWSWV
jgi:hypothetical protein